MYANRLLSQSRGQDHRVAKPALNAQHWNGCHKWPVTWMLQLTNQGWIVACLRTHLSSYKYFTNGMFSCCQGEGSATREGYAVLTQWIEWNGRERREGEEGEERGGGGRGERGEGEGRGEGREKRRGREVWGKSSPHPMKQLFTLVHLVKDLVTPHVLEYQSNIRLRPQWLPEWMIITLHRCWSKQLPHFLVLCDCFHSNSFHS